MTSTLLTAARLVDGEDELVLLPTHAADELYLTGFDPGFPEIRESAEPRPAADGTVDTTRLFGARAVTAQLVVMTPAALDRLRGWLAPARRPWMAYTPEGLPERRMQVRVAQHAAPLAQMSSRGLIDVSVQWRAPSGRAVSSQEHGGTANPTMSDDGRAYPRSYPLTYPPSTGQGTVVVRNDGNVDTDPLLRIHGPCAGPKIANETLGAALVFSSTLRIAAGDYVDLDTAERTALLNGLPAQSVYRHLDFTQSTWWPLVSGLNKVRFYPAEWDQPSRADIRWRDAYL